MMAEIMAPVGSFEMLQAALKAGADSVYFGVGKLSMRSKTGFCVDDLEKIVKLCGSVRTYLTLNTVMYDEDFDEFKSVAVAAKEAGVSAVIATDVAVVEFLRSIGMRVHMSTQANISNVEAVRFFSKYADAVVLARELSLDQIKQVCDRIVEEDIRGPGGEVVKVEVFVHGALCVSISGKCYMSLATYNSSANRGKCLHNCRRAYEVRDVETGDKLEISNRYVMSPSDLCTIGMIDKLVDAGVSIFKIEGRGRKPEYVFHVVRAYKEAVYAVEDGSYSEEKIKRWRDELASVYNRGFWEGGYYLGKRIGEWSESAGSKASVEKVYVGTCLNYYKKSGVGHFKMETGSLRKGEFLLVTGPTTGVVEFFADFFRVDETDRKYVSKGDEFTVKMPERVRVNDKLYVRRAKQNL